MTEKLPKHLQGTLTTKEAAAFLKCSPSALRKARRQERVVSAGKWNRGFYWKKSDLLKFRLRGEARRTDPVVAPVSDIWPLREKVRSSPENAFDWDASVGRGT